MRCIKCGAEIGDARVCSFCDTPRRNVLVGDNVIQGFKTSNVMHVILVKNYDKKLLQI